jgi:GNAT superfamily N-acetyltransferase
LLRIEDISEENLDDVFKICSWDRAFAPKDDPVLEKSREIKRRWLLDMLERHGPCNKIAYLDGRPAAQVLFYPEETITFYHDPRKDVLHLQCIFNSLPEAQHKGVGDALMKALVDECHTGLDCMRGRACSFVVTKPFPHEGDLPLDEFYSKYDFKLGNQELYLEVKGDYVPREILENRRLPEDLGRAVNFYNPTCEWGYFYAIRVKELLQGVNPDLPVDVFNLWERPEEYMKRSHKQQIAARTIINGREITPFLFWVDKDAFRREAEKALRKQGTM